MTQALTAYAYSVAENFPKNSDNAIGWLERRDQALGLKIIEASNNVSYPQSSQRYRFAVAKNEESSVARAIFDASFRNNPEGLIQQTEAILGKSFYPLRKRVVWIHIPNLTASIIESIVTKIGVLLAVACVVALISWALLGPIQRFLGLRDKIFYFVLLYNCFTLLTPVFAGCEDVSSVFRDLANKAQAERISLSKRGVCQLWLDGLKTIKPREKLEQKIP